MNSESKYFIIANPVSGYRKGNAILRLTIDTFTAAGKKVEYVVSQYKGHPLKIVQDIELELFDAIIVIGGDGTMHEVINGMMYRADKKMLPIGLIPAGTGNSLMHDFECLDPAQAIHNILLHRSRLIDLFEIRNGMKLIYFFNILGWGIPVDVNSLAEKLRFFKGQRYNVASLIEVFRNRKRKIKITINDNIMEGEYGFFLACNTKYTGNGMKMAPQAIIDDGLIDILIAKKISSLRLLLLFSKVFKGTHIDDKAISCFRAKSFSLETEVPHTLNIDGQDIGQTPVSITLSSTKVQLLY